MKAGFASRLNNWLKEALTDNLGIKALSLVFPLGLAFAVRGQHDEQQRTIPVDVVLRLPAQEQKRELMTTMPAAVHITVRGTTRAIDPLIQQGIAPLELDLRDGQTTRLALEPHMFSVPPDVEVKIVDPATIDLAWQDVETHRITIQAAITGTPVKGYQVKGEPVVSPAAVVAVGPRSQVELMQFARVAAFDVSGLTDGTHKRRIALDPPPPRVTFLGPAGAFVEVTIERRQTQAQFKNRPVQVVGADANFTLSPVAVDITVVGSPEVVNALRDEQIVPHVDFSQTNIDFAKTKHGALTLPVILELTNAKAGGIQPPRITVKW